jgi:5-methylcytosine-specific restriction protein A
MPNRPRVFNSRGSSTVRPRDDRPSAASRGYDSRWRKARLLYLAEHPLCVECAKKNRVEPAKVVDHIVPHKGDELLFWDPSNWQSLCKHHHDRKTASEDGGYGRKQELRADQQ